jgi:hypothetical protein
MNMILQNKESLFRTTKCIIYSVCAYVQDTSDVYTTYIVLLLTNSYFKTLKTKFKNIPKSKWQHGKCKKTSRYLLQAHMSIAVNILQFPL